MNAGKLSRRMSFIGRRASCDFAIVDYTLLVKGKSIQVHVQA